LQQLDNKLREEVLKVSEDKIKAAVNAYASAVFDKRRELGWSQKELGEHIGENQADVSRALSGYVTPKTVEIRKKITNILNID
jgi:ribosome-binding protein aMBF1 (putative translation factor)